MGFSPLFATFADPVTVGQALFDEMTRYVRFSAGDAQLLRTFHGHAAPHFERIAAEFYERIREHEEAHAVFTGEAQILRLQRSLVRWLDRLLTGPYDAHYFQATAEIGRVHVRVGLPQPYMFTAMALIRVELGRIATMTLNKDAGPTISAINRLLDLELAMMLEGYREHFVARLQKAADAKLPNEAYAAAVELEDTIVIGLDENHCIRLFNREAERTTGYAREEVLGQSFLDLFIPEALIGEHTRAMLDAPKDVTARISYEGALKIRTGKVLSVRWKFARTKDASSGIALFALGADISKEMAELERARHTERLAAIGTLAAGLAHEIRNPLNGAQLHLTFLNRALKRAGVSGDPIEAVGVVEEEIKRLSKLVTEFLDFARPTPLDKKPYSIRALCDRVVSLTVADAQNVGASLTTDLPVNDMSVELDAAKMEQVLLNLVRNAIEAVGPQGNGHVILRVRRLPRFAVIEVQDNGPGIPRQDAPIFDAFFSTKPGGTGLGLSIVHQLVTKHDGTIDVDSRPGETIFRVTLPLPLQ